MPCDTRLKANQTLTQRKEEVREVIARVIRGLTSGRVRAVVGKTGGIAFAGLTDTERDGVTDACCYRRVMASGNALALQAVARAEALAGRSVDRMAVAQGLHSHDGGNHWHHGH